MVARLNEIDPYYAFDFTIAEARTVISCRPRYPDALRDRPISFSAQLKLDDATPPGLRAAIDDFMVYGSVVQIPAENINALSIDMPGGLGEFAGGGIALDGKIAPAGAAEGRHLVLRVPPDPPVMHVPIMDILSRSKGPAGGFKLQVQDRAGLLTLDMRLNPATSTYDARLSYQFNDQVLPKDAIPVLALCNALAAGERMAIATLDGQILALGSGPFSHLNWPDGDGYLRCARQLPRYKNAQEPSSRCLPRSNRKTSTGWTMPTSCSGARTSRSPGLVPPPIATATRCASSSRKPPKSAKRSPSSTAARKPSSSLVASYPRMGNRDRTLHQDRQSRRTQDLVRRRRRRTDRNAARTC